MTEKYAAWVWLAEALGYCAQNAGTVLELYVTPENVQNALDTQDVSMHFTPAQLEKLRTTKPADYLPLLQRCKELGVQMVSFAEMAYPYLLRTIPNPPPVLYYKGDLTVTDAFLTLGVVGTRRPSAYGVQATGVISKGLAEAGVVLVSGLATGLDSEAHKAALAMGTPTVACIAFGHDLCYPAAHRKLKECIEHTGLVLGEYPPGTEVQKPFFLQRNRLIAGLSQGLCVAEARRASGTMNTVASALSYNRDVFAVPGSIFSPLSEGTNRLLAEGAYPATCAADILQHYEVELHALAQTVQTQPTHDTAPSRYECHRTAF